MEDELPTYPRIFQKSVGGDPALTVKWESFFKMPDDVHHWKMYLVTENGLTPPFPIQPAPMGPIAIQVAYQDNPGDEWWPLFYGAEPAWRYNRPSQVYVRPFGNIGTQFIVVAEVWLSKMPARVADKEKPKARPIGKRQA